jgi:formylglycine-generating enzyme required for sulfatase activity/serine/threonine protein kinase
MEYVEGSMDGEAYLQKHGKMELVSGLEVGLQVAKGLEIAHAKGICHLDLKPANLLLRQANGQWEVKIIDFGLSRVVTSLKNEAMAKSRSGKSMLMQEVFGTLDYAPPEQLGDIRHGRPGPHSDIFSFGATLYRLLSGENPRTINPLCLPNNPQLFQLLAQCLMADPSRRPSSAIELVERLEQIDPQVFDSFAMGTIDTSGGYKPAPVSSASVSSGGHVLQNWKKQREASFRSLFIQAQELIHSDANQAMEKWSEAREFAPELCDQEFGDWEIYIKEQIKVQQKAAKRREQFEQLYTTAQELVQNNPLKTLEKLEEARQFAADLCDESFQQLVNFAKEEQQRHRQFKQLCTSAKDLVKSNPMEALDKLVKAEKLAPHLCDKEFGKWVNEATQEQQRHQKFKQLYASARNLVKSNPAEALEKLTEAEKLAPNLCDKGFHQLKSDVIQKQQRRVTFGQLFDDAKKLALHNPQEAIVKLKKAQQIEQDLCNERFQDLVNYAVEKQRRLQFDALCSEAQDMASSDLSAAWKKLSEAKEFAPDLCNESFERWVQYVSEKYRHSQFNLAYREAQELSKSDPQSAQQKLLKLQQAAPDLCNEDFHKWVAYAENAANKGTRSVFGKIASVFSSIPQPKYAEIDARPIPSRFMSDAPSAPLWLKEEWQERMEFLRRIIDLYRPMWLPEHVARNESLDAVPGPRSGGSLVQLSDLPSGLRRKVILARDGSPLLEMVEIPAGKFLMGSDKPQREVYLHAYWIARTPVTNRMWQKFLQESGYQPPRDDHDGDYLKHWSGNKPPADKLDHPVVNVSYIAVWAFCDYYGLMLPSEAQWEKAARGVDGRIYPWGDQQPTPKLCNFSGSEIRDTTPVGKYPDGISPFGLVDCAGNVWEWCADEYSSNLLQELDPNSGRVIRFCNNRANSRLALRGGSFSHGTEAVRCAYRRSFTAGYCDNYIGFRPSQDEAL